VTAAPAVLFDLDGCLIDSVPAITGSLNKMLVELGITPQPEARLRPLIGPPLQAGLEALFTQLGVAITLCERAIEVYRRHYAKMSLTHTLEVPGIRDALTALSSDHQLHVVTSKPVAFAQPILSSLELRDYFGVVYGPSTDATGERKTETLRRALIEQRLRASQCVMVGDRHHDIEAAAAQRVMSVGVTWGIGDADELKVAGANVIVDRVDELADTVRQLTRRVRSAFQ